MAGIHVRIGIASGEVSRDVERGGVRNVLLHSCQIRSNPHSGDDAARILAARAQKRPPTGHESRLPPCRVEHAAKLWIGPVTSGANDDRLAGPIALRALMYIVSVRSSTLPFCQRLSKRLPVSGSDRRE